MHTGAAVQRGADWFGSTVNIAARVAALELSWANRTDGEIASRSMRVNKCLFRIAYDCMCIVVPDSMCRAF